MSFNDMIINAFRTNEGEVTDPIPFGRSLGLLHIPKKNGEVTVVPLLALERDGAWFVVASAGGAPKHPAWMYGLRRAAAIDLEVAGDLGQPIRLLRVAVTELEGAERDELWEAFKGRSRQFAEYQARSEGRVFPIFRLAPID